jgi:hypothetical protein
MSQEQVARDLAYHLKQEYEREFIAAKKAVLHTEVKKIAAPEMWERLAIWLEKTVELANECLGESGLAYDRRANKMTISTTLGRAKSIVVKFNPSTGRISYGAPGQNLDRVRYPPQSGWLDEWDCLKGSCPVGFGVALKRASV